jgi:hypothetical protein
MYLDGTVQPSTGDGHAITTQMGSGQGEIKLGGLPGYPYVAYFSGSSDKVRISNIARSADWILTEYRNQSAPATYISAGPRITSGASVTRVRHGVRSGV